MEDKQFSMGQFDAVTNELKNIAEQYKGIVINGIDDAIGMELAINAKRKLVSTRTDIAKKMKLLRDGANKFAKDVIIKEKELIGIVGVVENDINIKIQAIEDEKERLKRIESLPIRKEELSIIGLEKDYDDEFILSMSYKDRCEFIRCEKARLYEEELERKRVKEAEEKRLKDIEEAKEQGRKEAEEKFNKQKEIDDARKVNEDRTKDVIGKLGVGQEDVDDSKENTILKYKQFLAIHGYNENTKNQFYIQKVEGGVNLYKFISSFKL